MTENLQGQDNLSKPAEVSPPSGGGDGAYQPDAAAVAAEAERYKALWQKAEEEKRAIKDQNAKLYARTKEAEETVKLIKQERNEPANSSSQGADELKEWFNLRMNNYSEEELDFAQTFARAKGKRLSEVIKEPQISAAIETMRTQSRSSQATPPPARSASSMAVPEPNIAALYRKGDKAALKEVWRQKLEQQKARR